MPFDTTVRANVWSVTINNPTSADDEDIAQARQRGWKVDGQLEVGESGTKHYQLMIRTPQLRGSALKKQFRRAHIEVARDPRALEAYVHKDETREAQLPQQNELYPSLQKLWDLFSDWIDARDEDIAKESWKPEKWIQRFDMFIDDSILDGYVVETMGVNPQIRSCVKKYGRSMVIRSKNRRQTDRQTRENLIAGSSINGQTTETAEEADGEETTSLSSLS